MNFYTLHFRLSNFTMNQRAVFFIDLIKRVKVTI